MKHSSPVIKYQYWYTLLYRRKHHLGYIHDSQNERI